MEKRSSRGAGGLTSVAPASVPLASPDPEVAATATRRQFTRDYKLSILRQADACRQPGEIGALLRREGLYSSNLTAWRKQRDEGALVGEGRHRGPKSRRLDPRHLELERENRRLRRDLEKAHLVINLQKKLATALGIPLSDLPPDGNEP
jgi:transposase-like protein